MKELCIEKETVTKTDYVPCVRNRSFFSVTCCNDLATARSIRTFRPRFESSRKEQLIEVTKLFILCLFALLLQACNRL